MMRIEITVLGLIACILALIAMFARSRKRAKHVWESTPGGPYTVTLTDDEIICEHPKRPKESIRWDAVTEIRLVTTSEGPFLPDMWYLFLGDKTGCSVPSEANGFDQLWNVFKQRFPGLDYNAIINAGTADNQKTIWKTTTVEPTAAADG